MPWNGQSLARPDASFSNVACHMNSPVSSRNAISTPRSPPCFGSRMASLLVPMSTTPLPTVGLPYDCDPSSATHFTFLPVLMSQEVGAPFMSDTMLRLGVPPHIGQSFANTPAEAAATNTEITTIRTILRSLCAFCAFCGPSAALLRPLLVPVDLHVIEKHVRDPVGINTRAARHVRDLVHLLDGPRLGLGAIHRPHLAVDARRAVLLVIDAQFHAIPLVGVPLERHAHRHLVGGLPRMQ